MASVAAPTYQVSRSSAPRQIMRAVASSVRIGLAQPRILGQRTVDFGNGLMKTVVPYGIDPGVYLTYINGVEVVYIDVSEWTGWQVQYASSPQWDYVNARNLWKSLIHDTAMTFAIVGSPAVGGDICLSARYDYVNNIVFTLSENTHWPGRSVVPAGEPQYYTTDHSVYDPISGDPVIGDTSGDNPNPATGGVPPTEVYDPNAALAYTPRDTDRVSPGLDSGGFPLVTRLQYKDIGNCTIYGAVISGRVPATYTGMQMALQCANGETWTTVSMQSDSERHQCANANDWSGNLGLFRRCDNFLWSVQIPQGGSKYRVQIQIMNTGTVLATYTSGEITIADNTGTAPTASNAVMDNFVNAALDAGTAAQATIDAAVAAAVEVTTNELTETYNDMVALKDAAYAEMVDLKDEALALKDQAFAALQANYDALIEAGGNVAELLQEQVDDLTEALANAQARIAELLALPGNVVATGTNVGMIALLGGGLLAVIMLLRRK